MKINPSLPNVGSHSSRTSSDTVTATGNRYHSRLFDNPFLQRWSIFVIISCLIVLILMVLIMAAVPPVSRDALTHHLAVPKLWIEKGGLIEIPDLNVSYYPMNLNLLYVIPMLFGNDIIPKYIHFLFALATAWLLYIYIKQRTSQLYALTGALLFLSTPVIVKLSISVYVDLGLIFFSWASLHFLLSWARSINSLKYLMLSAIFCGLGLGTKYNGIIVLFLLTLFVPIIYIRSAGRRYYKKRWAVGFPTIFLLVSMTICSPWMIKNYYLTKNPIYPLYKDKIGSHSNGSTITNMAMKPWLQRKLIYRESALETILIPIRVFFQGQDDDPRFFDGKLNPFLFLCPLLLLVMPGESDPRLKLEQLILSVYSLLFLLYASFMVDMRIRYISPIVPSLVVLSVLGIKNCVRWIAGYGIKGTPDLFRWIVAGIVMFMLSLNAAYVGAVFGSVDPMPFIMGKTSRDAYLTNKLPEYPAIQYVNRINHTDVKVMALFLGKRLYYFDKPVDFDTQLFAGIVSGTTDGKSLSSQLQSNGFTYSIIGINHFEAWINRVFTNEQIKYINQWLREDCQLLFYENGYAVFGLVPKNDTRSNSLKKGIVQ